MMLIELYFCESENLNHFIKCFEMWMQVIKFAETTDSV